MSRFTHKGTMNTRFSLPPRRTLVAALFGVLHTGFGHAQAQTTEATTLSTVVVTAAGFEQAVEDAPASITVIPREELEQKAYKDVVDALRDVPGVTITGSGSFSDISLRGMSSSYTLLLVDGRRQNSRETRPNSDNSGIEQGWLPPVSAIERIEVIRGPMSSLYGSDALGGVVNIITRQVPRAWSGSIRTDATLQERSHSGDIYQGQVWLAGPIVDDKLGFQASSQKTRRNEDSFGGGLGEQDVTSYNAKFSLTPTRNHDVTLEAGHTKQERNARLGKSVAVGGRGKTSLVNYDKNLFALSHTGRWGKATSNSYVQQEKIDNPGRKMSVKNLEASSTLTLPLGERHLTTIGLSAKRDALTDAGNLQKGKSTSKFTDTISRYQWALFAENEWSMTDAFALTAGVRMNRDENYGTHWTPRLYGVWHATENWTFKGGVSSGFHAPDLRESAQGWGHITGGGNAIPGVVVGNASLKPETSISQEFGIVWDNRDNLNLSLTVHNTDFKNRIATVYQCDGDQATGGCDLNGENYWFIQDLVNVNRAVIRGAEATVTWQALENLRITGNYSHTRSKQKTGANKGKPLNRLPKHTVNASADWQASDDVSVWGRVNFRGRTTETRSGSSVSVTPSFAFVDLGLNYQVRKNVNIGLGVYNLFDKQVNKKAGYDLTYDGRRYWLSLTAGF